MLEPVAAAGAGVGRVGSSTASSSSSSTAATADRASPRLPRRPRLLVLVVVLVVLVLVVVVVVLIARRRRTRRSRRRPRRPRRRPRRRSRCRSRRRPRPRSRSPIRAASWPASASTWWRRSVGPGGQLRLGVVEDAVEARGRARSRAATRSSARAGRGPSPRGRRRARRAGPCPRRARPQGPRLHAVAAPRTTPQRGGRPLRGRPRSELSWVLPSGVRAPWGDTDGRGQCSRSASARAAWRPDRTRAHSGSYRLAPAATTQSAPSSPGSRMPVTPPASATSRRPAARSQSRMPGLVEAVQPAASDPGEVDRRGPGPAHVADLGGISARARRLERAPLRRVAESRADEGAGEVGRAPSSARCAVQEGARAADRGERLAGARGHGQPPQARPPHRGRPPRPTRPGSRRGSWSCRRAGRSPTASPVVPGRWPLSSAMRPSSGRAEEMASRSSRSASRSASETMSVALLLASTPLCGPPNRPSRSSPAVCAAFTASSRRASVEHRASLDRSPRAGPHFHLQTLDF